MQASAVWLWARPVSPWPSLRCHHLSYRVGSGIHVCVSSLLITMCCVRTEHLLRSGLWGMGEKH